MKTCKVSVLSRKDVKEETIECDIVLSAYGVTANIENIGLESLVIKTERGLISVTDDMIKPTALGQNYLNDLLQIFLRD